MVGNVFAPLLNWQIQSWILISTKQQQQHKPQNRSTKVSNVTIINNLWYILLNYLWHLWFNDIINYSQWIGSGILLLLSFFLLFGWGEAAGWLFTCRRYRKSVFIFYIMEAGRGALEFRFIHTYQFFFFFFKYILRLHKANNTRATANMCNGISCGRTKNFTHLL